MAANEGKRKRRINPALLWGGIGFVVVFLGVAVALWYLSQNGFDDRMAGMEQLVETYREEEPGAEPAAGEGERTYRVQEGDNLWSIARQGNLVDEPWEWRTIMVQNKDKIDYAFLAEESGQWKVLIETGEELRVRAQPPVETSGPVKKKFAVQLMTVPARRLPEALGIVKTLLSDGDYGYLYRIEEDGEPAYRVRVGFFETQQEADSAARAIVARYSEMPQYPRDYWVVVPSDRELRGDLLDFGAQRTRPWVIELPQRGTHGEALEELRQAAGLGEFVYIAQGRGGHAARFVYRTRIGFFETAEQADEVLQEHRERWPQLSRARIVELKNFAETLPGQRFKTRAPSS